MMTNNQGVGTRELALMILLEIERGEKSHIVLRQVLEKYQYLSKQDRAFLTRLTCRVSPETGSTLSSSVSASSIPLASVVVRIIPFTPFR